MYGGVALLVVGGYLMLRKGEEPLPPGVPTASEISAMMTKEELADARAAFESAYQSKLITYDQYHKLYIVYLRRTYYLDLYPRDQAIADEYWAATKNVTDTGEIYTIYQEYLAMIDGGNGGPTEVDFQVTGGTWYDPVNQEQKSLYTVQRGVGLDVACFWWLLTYFSNPGIDLDSFTLTMKIAGVTIGTLEDEDMPFGPGFPHGSGSTWVLMPVIPASVPDGTHSFTVEIQTVPSAAHAPVTIPAQIKITTSTTPPPPTQQVPTQLASIWQYAGDGTGTSRKLVWVYRGSDYLVYDSAAPEGTSLYELKSGDQVWVWVSQACTLQLPNGSNYPLNAGWSDPIPWP